MDKPRHWVVKSTVPLKSGVFLGFDFGECNVGVAVGQGITGTATALETIRVKRKADLWAAIERLVSSWKPTAFVVGLSHQENGSENPITQPTLRFCRQLNGRFNLPVYTVDETLTTMESRHVFFQQNPTQSAEFFHHKDRIAAQLILQTWLSVHPEITE